MHTSTLLSFSLLLSIPCGLIGMDEPFPQWLLRPNQKLSLVSLPGPSVLGRPRGQEPVPLSIGGNPRKETVLANNLESLARGLLPWAVITFSEKQQHAMFDYAEKIGSPVVFEAILQHVKRNGWDAIPDDIRAKVEEYAHNKELLGRDQSLRPSSSTTSTSGTDAAEPPDDCKKKKGLLYRLLCCCRSYN